MAEMAARIVGSGSAFPEQVFTNEDFEKYLDTSDEWIRARTGIQTRRIAYFYKGESSLTFAVEAAQEALEMAEVSPKEIDVILLGTVTPDTLMPSTAVQVQEKLGAFNSFAFDFQAACAGFLYGLTTADSYIRSGVAKTALVIGSETLSTVTNWQDRTTCVLFGDAAGAVVLKPSEDPDHRILSTKLGADGRYKHLLKMAHGYSGVPPYHPEYSLTKRCIEMQGKEVFKIAVKTMGDTLVEVLNEHNITPQDIDMFIFHQANMRILDMCTKKLGVDSSKAWTNIHKYGNTSSATLPTCLDEAWRTGAIKLGDTLGLASFGGGLTWGAGVVKL